MGKIYYKNQEYTGSNGGGGGDVPSSAIPIANTISKFDNSAKMNSTDMTSTEITNLVNSLDAQGANLADYVIEQGISDSWTYRKWNSGIAECWEIWTGNLTHYYSGGSLQGYSCTVTFPTNLFISTPLVNVDGRIGNGFYLGTSIDVSAISSANIVAMSTSSGTVACTFHIHAIGKWK